MSTSPNPSPLLQAPLSRSVAQPGRWKRSQHGAIVGTLMALGGAALLLMPACNGPVEGVVTETGNPSLIHQKKLEVRMKKGELHVTGGAGSVPDGALVSIINEDSGKRVTVTAEEDGSFTLSVAAEAGEEVALQVEGGGKKQRITLAKGAAQEQIDAGKPAVEEPAAQCTAWMEELESIGESAASADRTCEIDSDCMVVATGVSCLGSCDVAALSAIGAQEHEALKEASGSGLCEQLEAGNCPPIGVADCAAEQPAAACVDNACALARDDDVDEAPAVPAQPKEQAPPAIPQACIHELAHLLQLENELDAKDRSCSQDADCTVARVSTDCYSGCDYHATSVGGMQQFLDNEVVSANQEQCLILAQNECEIPTTPCPASPPPDARCVEGTCGGVEGQAPPPPPQPGPVPPDTAPECAALMGGFQGIEAELAGLDNSCAVDADCVLATASTSCLNSCNEQAVNTGAWGEYQQSVLDAEQAFCPTFDEGQCVAPGCTLIDSFPNGVACLNGVCGAAEAPDPEAATSSNGPVGMRCFGDSDCAPGLTCKNDLFGERGICTQSCAQQECPEGTRCVADLLTFQSEASSGAFCMRPCAVDSCSALDSQCESHQRMSQLSYCF